MRPWLALSSCLLAASLAVAGAQTRTNLAVGKPAQQSSTYAPQYPAAKGVDGVRVSGFFHTNAGPNPWWQVDLQRDYALDDIVLYNRTDCCGERARRVTVLFSRDGRSWDSIYRHDGKAFKMLRVAGGGRTARYVRVQLAESNYLHLAEVEVYGQRTGGAAAAAAVPTAIGVGPETSAGTAAATELASARAAVASELASAFDLAALGKSHDSGLASVMLTGLQTLMGEVPASQEATLRQNWSPYYEGGDGLEGQELGAFAAAASDVLVARGAMAIEARGFDAAWQEAALAAAYGSEEGTREALGLARMHQQSMAGLNARAQQAVKRVLSTPIANGGARIDARKAAYEGDVRESWAAVASRPPSSLAKGPGFVLIRLEREVLPTEPTHRSGKAIEYDRIKGGGSEVVTREDDERTVTDTSLIATSRTTQTATPISPAGGSARVRRNTIVQGSVTWTAPPPIVPLGYVFKPDPKLSGTATGVPPGTDDTIAVFGADGQVSGGVSVFLNPQGLHWQKQAPLVFPSRFEEGTVHLVVRAEVGPTVNILDYLYEFRRDAIAPGAAIAGADDAAPPLVFKRTPEHVKELVAFHRANIERIRQNLAADERQLAGETNTDRRAELEFRIIQEKSDLQHEEDLIASFESGTLVHTRSAFDDYAENLFVESIKEGHEKQADFQRAAASIPRLLALFPPDQQAAMQAFVDRQLTPAMRAKLDKAKLRQVAEALSQQLQGYWSGEAARGIEKATEADDYLKRAERVKLISDVTLTVGGVGWSQTGTVAYFGATGWVEGGPVQALAQAAGAVSLPAAVAAEALKGYRDDGWRGAASNAAITFMLAKAAGSSTAKGAGAGLEKATVREAMQIAEFRAAQRRGEALVRDLERASAELAQARTAMRDVPIVRNLERQLADKAAAVQSDLHAKGFLKYRADRPLKNLFVTEIQKVHYQVEAEFHRGMMRRGWNAQELRPIRNASSAGSVNMDFDIGLVEGPGSVFLRNGQRTGARQWQEEAQAAWDQAYRTVTGRSAGHAMEEVTTRFHPEAYKDLAWIEKGRVKAAWSAQAGDVTRYKAQTVLSGGKVGEIGQLTRVMEASRGAAKDIETKLLDRLRRMAGVSEAGGRRRADLVRRWEEVSKVLKSIGEGTIDPIHGSRRIRQLTGGYDIPDVIDHAATLIGEIGKRTGK